MAADAGVVLGGYCWFANPLGSPDAPLFAAISSLSHVPHDEASQLQAFEGHS
jgi:hypothetical protein